jgi:hypothetical protein
MNSKRRIHTFVVCAVDTEHLTNTLKTVMHILSREHRQHLVSKSTGIPEH